MKFYLNGIIFFGAMNLSAPAETTGKRWFRIPSWLSLRRQIIATSPTQVITSGNLASTTQRQDKASRFEEPDRNNDNINTNTNANNLNQNSLSLSWRQDTISSIQSKIFNHLPSLLIIGTFSFNYFFLTLSIWNSLGIMFICFVLNMVISRLSQRAISRQNQIEAQSANKQEENESSCAFVVIPTSFVYQFLQVLFSISSITFLACCTGGFGIYSYYNIKNDSSIEKLLDEMIKNLLKFINFPSTIVVYQNMIDPVVSPIYTTSAAIIETISPQYLEPDRQNLIKKKNMIWNEIQESRQLTQTAKTASASPQLSSSQLSSPAKNSCPSYGNLDDRESPAPASPLVHSTNLENSKEAKSVGLNNETNPTNISSPGSPNSPKIKKTREIDPIVRNPQNKKLFFASIGALAALITWELWKAHKNTKQ